MLDQDKVLVAYHANYDMAIGDGHTDAASKIAWEWTWEAIQRRFTQIKAAHEGAKEEAVNKTHFG